MIRVGVVDDHALVRKGLRALLSTTSDLTVVAEGASASEARRIAVADKPDVLVLDINLPDGSGIEVCRDVQRSAPAVAVLMLTMFDDDASVFAAMRAGARGYVLKGADPEDVLRAIAAVASGNAIFGPGVAARALAYLTGPREERTSFPELSARERDVLELIATGVDNAAVAARLHLSSKTVSNHITSIFTKLQVASRAEAIVRAREAGLGTDRGH